MAQLIDAHAHMDGYGDLTDAALEQIRAHNILTVSTAMDPSSYERGLQIAARCELILPTFGVHPWNAARYENRLKDLERFADSSPMFGEIGLDYHWVKVPSQYPAQHSVLAFFLSKAAEQNKIVNLHTKGAEKEIRGLLDRFGIERAIIHWYSGPMDVLADLISLGCYFTVGVDVLYSEHVRKIARKLPLERLLTETDNPGGTRWLTGEPGMPACLEDVIRELARLRNTPLDEIVEAVYGNFERLIRDDPWLDDIRGKFFSR